MLDRVFSFLPTVFASGASAIVVILAAMLVVAVVEIAIPLHKRDRWSALHLGPNLALTLLTFATNIFFNAAVVLGLAWLQLQGIGLLNVAHVADYWHAAIVVLALDMAFYVAHVSMHKIPVFWRVHSVHHSDPTVDVTTTIRQHPLEGFIRYGFIAIVAIPLGASPTAFAVYRSASALNALLEHANIQLPAWLDRTLSWITTWPNTHKVHHSRERRFTDSNYGNLFSVWDRLFGTFTLSHLGADIRYGLEGTTEADLQTATALLTAPFGRRARLASAAMTTMVESRPQRSEAEAPQWEAPS